MDVQLPARVGGVLPLPTSSSYEGAIYQGLLVGASAGGYTDGEGERDDVLAVIDWSRARWPGLRVYLGGFSFGAAMALGVAARAAPRGSNPMKTCRKSCGRSGRRPG